MEWERQASYTFKFLEAKTGPPRVQFQSAMAQARSSDLKFKQKKAGVSKGSPIGGQAALQRSSSPGKLRIQPSAPSPNTGLPPLVQRSKNGPAKAIPRASFGVLGRNLMFRPHMKLGASPDRLSPMPDGALCGVQEMLPGRPLSAGTAGDACLSVPFIKLETYDSGEDRSTSTSSGSSRVDDKASVSDEIIALPRQLQDGSACSSLGSVGSDDSILSHRRSDTDDGDIKTAMFVNTLSNLTNKIAGIKVSPHPQWPQKKPRRPRAIDDLPEDIIWMIIGYLSVGDIHSLGRTCSRLWKLASSDYVWKPMYKARWSTWIPGKGSGPRQRKWFNNYRRRFRSSLHWFEADYEAKPLAGHTDSVLALCNREDGILASGSRDGTCRLWSLDKMREINCITYSECAPLSGGERCCRAAILDERTLVCSFAGDFSIIPEYRRCVGACEPSSIRLRQYNVQANGSDIASMSFCQERKVITGNMSGGVALWDISIGTKVAELVGHMGSVDAVKCQDGASVWTVCEDGFLRMFDIRASNACVVQFQAHKGELSALDMCRDTIATGGMDGNIRTWDARALTTSRVATGPTPLLTLEGVHGDWVSDIVLDDDKVVSGGWDTLVSLQEIRSPEINQDPKRDYRLNWNGFTMQEKKDRSTSAQMRHHKGAVYALQPLQDGVATAGADNDVFVCVNQR